MVLPDATVEALRQVAAAHRDVRALYVFGSRVVGEARADSDLDVGVLYVSATPVETTLALGADLERSVGRAIDLVDLAGAGAFLALDIVRGERVYCRDALETDRFELYVLARAGDLLPFERQRQALLLHDAR